MELMVPLVVGSLRIHRCEAIALPRGIAWPAGEPAGLTAENFLTA